MNMRFLPPMHSKKNLGQNLYASLQGLHPALFGPKAFVTLSQQQPNCEYSHAAFFGGAEAPQKPQDFLQYFFNVLVCVLQAPCQTHTLHCNSNMSKQTPSQKLQVLGQSLCIRVNCALHCFFSSEHFVSASRSLHSFFPCVLRRLLAKKNKITE